MQRSPQDTEQETRQAAAAPLTAPPARERLGLWAFGTVAMLVLAALLAFFMWRLGQEPLEFELQSDQSTAPIDQPENP